MAGTPSSVAAEVGASMKAAQDALRKAVKSAMTDAGKAARKELESAGKRHTGGDLRFSNMGGARIGVRVKTIPDGIEVDPRGPWGMLQPGARPHRIGAMGRRMKVGGEWRTGPFRHPGTRNTSAWDRGQESTFEILGRQIAEDIVDDVEGVF